MPNKCNKVSLIILYIYIHMYTHTHTHRYIYIYIHTHTHTHTHRHTQIHTYTYTYIYIYTHIDKVDKAFHLLIISFIHFSFYISKTKYQQILVPYFKGF